MLPMTYTMSVFHVENFPHPYVLILQHPQALGDYRQTFVMKLPSLHILDKQPVTVEEKVSCNISVQFVLILAEWTFS